MAPMSNRKSKTSRFPVARIKKIMQTDEEVGKLASATPVMISKSLECFMQHLISEACKETRQRGSKKMTAYHLKQTILTRHTLDFLLPLTDNIADPVQTEDKPRAGPSRRAAKGEAASGSTRKRTGEGKQEFPSGAAYDWPNDPAVPPVPEGSVLPSIGTWMKEPIGGGGSGEGGRGMFDDYEEDEDDY